MAGGGGPSDSPNKQRSRNQMTEFDPYHKWLGIASKDQPPHHYRLLGIDLFESDLDVIEIASRQGTGRHDSMA